ncbi:hypothetical protein [Thermosediminibacter litoriperuensis]|uniref:Uncharacterized protein n=1 Tax=Thermosediminibacter litoriperuensis TaxID=291989 RepID=A0A5S5AZW7_9FIRM|nr:hypothetical protein [Thermosediminibacter litoriperuensis]TYP59848.1 hypothetical protein LZ11_00004 [Thermosediminibacter litoriperuensis]
MSTLPAFKARCKPSYIEGVDTCEDAMRRQDWSGEMLGVRCPKCQELFFLFYTHQSDNFGSFRKMWGFCTSCRHRFEGVVNK